MILISLLVHLGPYSFLSLFPQPLKRPSGEQLLTSLRCRTQTRIRVLEHNIVSQLTIYGFRRSGGKMRSNLAYPWCPGKVRGRARFSLLEAGWGHLASLRQKSPSACLPGPPHPTPRYPTPPRAGGRSRHGTSAGQWTSLRAYFIIIKYHMIVPTKPITSVCRS